MRRIIFILFFIGSLLSVQAQLAVASFSENPTGQDAKIHYPKKDQDGRLCALLKISTTQKGFTFNCGSLPVVDVVYKDSEVWVYLPDGAMKIKITHRELGSLEGDNINHGFYEFDSPLKSGHEYYMKLVSGSVKTTVETREIEMGWLILTSEPSGADVYRINNGMESLEGQTPFQPNLAYGNYDFRIKKNFFHDYRSNISINQETQKVNVILQPAHGWLHIASNPSGVKVTIDGVKGTYTTPCTTDTLPSGSYTVRLSKEKYASMQKFVTIEDGETARLDVDMTANFSTITINSLPNAEIFLNGNKVGATTYTAELTPGLYDIETRLASHTPTRQQLRVEPRKDQTLQINPIPRYCKLDVVTTPFGANVSVDGVARGTTPITIKDILVGMHTITISKDDYSTISRQMWITDSSINTINTEMSRTKTISVASTPSNVTVYLDGKRVGTTPCNVETTVGSHTIKLENGNSIIDETIVVEANSSDSFFYNVTPTKLAVNVSPSGALVYLDGKCLSNGSYNGYASPGTHLLTVKKEGYNPESTTIEVKEHDISRVNVTLSLNTWSKVKNNWNKYDGNTLPRIDFNAISVETGATFDNDFNYQGFYYGLELFPFRFGKFDVQLFDIGMYPGESLHYQPAIGFHLPVSKGFDVTLHGGPEFDLNGKSWQGGFGEVGLSWYQADFFSAEAFLRFSYNADQSPNNPNITTGLSLHLSDGHLSYDYKLYDKGIVAPLGALSLGGVFGDTKGVYVRYSFVPIVIHGIEISPFSLSIYKKPEEDTVSIFWEPNVGLRIPFYALNARWSSESGIAFRGGLVDWVHETDTDNAKASTQSKANGGHYGELAWWYYCYDGIDLSVFFRCTQLFSKYTYFTIGITFAIEDYISKFITIK